MEPPGNRWVGAGSPPDRAVAVRPSPGEQQPHDARFRRAPRHVSVRKRSGSPCYIRVNGLRGVGTRLRPTGATRFDTLTRVSRRLAVMAHYDHRGGVGPHVRRQVESVSAAVDRMIVVSTAELTDESRAWLGERAELVERSNYGYDFTSYQVGLHRAGLADDLTSYDEVVICNDTYVPVTPYDVIFDAMADQPVDFWGLTRTERI